MKDTQIMYDRVDQMEKLWGPFTPREKALLWQCYSMARLDAIIEQQETNDETL